MKKFLRALLILLGIIVGGILVLGLVEPKDISVSRTTYINSTSDIVWEQIVKFKNWPHWSPWYELDSTAVMKYTGNDGEVGSGYTWKGDDKKTGEGTMKMTALKAGEMDWELQFQKPREGKATGMFTTKDSSSGVNVSWTMNMHMGYPFNAMLAFMNMDKMLGSDFERGLSNMKKYCEAVGAGMPKVDIKQVPFAAHTYAGIRKTLGMAEMSKFFMEAYGSLGKEAGPRIAGPAAALYFTWDTVKHTSDLAAAFPVADTSKPVKGASFFAVPAGNAYMAVHMGGYSNLGITHNAMMRYVANKKQQTSLVLEEYIKGPHETPDSTQWVTNIYYLIK
jgi:hypothetical protein